MEVDEHVEPVVGSAMDEVADDYDVDRDSLALAVEADLTWMGIYDGGDEYEDAVIHLGDRDSLDVADDLREHVQMVHDRAANQIVGEDVGAYNDQYVSPTSLAPDSYTPVNGEVSHNDDRTYPPRPGVDRRLG